MSSREICHSCGDPDCPCPDIPKSPIKGFIGVDVFGRKYIDKCPTQEHHLTKAEVPPGKERPGCRFYLDDLLSECKVGDEVEIRLPINIEVRIISCRSSQDGDS